jgi:hypothetical protein
MKFGYLTKGKIPKSLNNRLKYENPKLYAMFIKRIIIKVFLVISFFVFAGNIPAAEYFMSTNGSDLNDGTTESLSWATFEHSFTVMNGGDTLTILDGTYFQQLHPLANMSGTESAYTLFRAKNPGNVILAPTSIGNAEFEGVIYVYSNISLGVTSYIHFDGLFAKGVGEHPAISLASVDFATEEEMSHHLKVTRCGAMGSVCDVNLSAFDVGDVRDVLVEDCFAFGFGRKAMQLYGAKRITVRRVVVRYDWWEGDTYKPDDPRVNLSAYNTIDATLENIIALDAGPHPVSSSPDRAGLVVSGNQGGGTTIDGSENVKYLGCLVFNNNEFATGLNGFEVNGGTGDPVKNLLFKDIVVHGADYGFNINDNVDTTTVENITTIFNNLVGVRVNLYPTYDISNVVINKGVSVNNTYWGMDWDTSMAVVSNSTVTNNGAGVVLEPEYEPVIDYLPINTPVSGFERGAIVMNKYVDGVLTSDPLWPWPYEDILKQYMCNTVYLQEIEDTINNYDGTSINYVPGLCASGKTLTEYVWSYLGNPTPSYIYKNTYYVSTSGNDANSGLSEAEAWRTITYAASAASPVEAGDTVFIKAGDYGNEHVQFQTDGASSYPIVFEGYQNIPGDNPNLNHSFGDPLDASVMPLLDGGNRTSGGTALTLHSRQHIVLKNLQITKYEAGIDGWNASSVTLDNITATSFGDVSADYSGTAITFSMDEYGNGGDYNILNNCFVENAAAEGFSLAGDYNQLTNCTVYCDEDSVNAAMDYYIVFEGNNNTVGNCYAERIGWLDHDGHGIGFKGNCENNYVHNSIAKNLGGGFYVRHRACKNNVFDHCTTYGLFGLLVRDGASHNTFRNCTSIDAWSAVLFYDTDEDDSTQYAGRNNIFENCIFRNTIENVIDFFYYGLPSPCDSNTFVNCVIDGGDYLFNCDRENAENKLINSIVVNVQNYSRTQSHQDSLYSLNVEIANSDFWNNGFVAPAGTNIIISNPDFADLANHDYHLNSTSQCIDAGTSTNAPATDYDGNPRPSGGGFDMGAYEYQYIPHAYYVSIAGSNSNPGTEAQPWLTVQYGADHIFSGDTLIIMAGTYNEKVIVPVSGVLIKNYPNQTAILDGSGLAYSNAMIEISNQSDITIEGLEIANNIQLDAQGILISGNCQNIAIRNNKIHDIHFSSDPNAPANENTNSQPLIVYGTETTAVSGLIITGNEIYNCRPGYSEALSVDGNIDGFEISNNLIHDITNIGIVAAGHYQVCPDPLLDQPRNGVMKSNQTYNCLSPYAASGGIYIDGARDIIIENNITYQNDYGIEVGCEIIGKSASGITVKNNLVYNNRITGIALGGFDYPAGSGKIENCIFNNNTLFKNDSINDFNGEMLITYTENCSVFDNIFSTTNQNIAFYLDVAPVNLFFDYNLYYCPGGNVALEFSWNGATYMGLADFQTGTSQDANSLYGDPQFVSAILPNPDLHIQNTSLAVDNGDPAYVPATGETDIDGGSRIVNSIIDMGADEFSNDILLDLKVFLEGPFNVLDMNTNILGEIPLSQPFNVAPWNYSGTESVDTIPADVVDWVLIELRDTTDASLATGETIIARLAAFLLNDGSVVDTAGNGTCSVAATVTNNLYVVIRHRNHLAIMSANPLTKSGGIYSYDFTTPAGQAYGTDAQKDLGSGVYGMISSDANADGNVNGTDKSAWENQAGEQGYKSTDFGLDGQVNNTDKDDYWSPNVGEGSQLPE